MFERVTLRDFGFVKRCCGVFLFSVQIREFWASDLIWKWRSSIRHMLRVKSLVWRCIERIESSVCCAPSHEQGTFLWDSTCYLCLTLIAIVFASRNAKMYAIKLKLQIGIRLSIMVMYSPSVVQHDAKNYYRCWFNGCTDVSPALRWQSYGRTD